MEIILSIILVLLILIEWCTGKISGKQVYQFRNTFVNAVLGVFTIFSEFVCTFIALPFLNFIYHKHPLFVFDKSSVTAFIVLFFLADFCDYWFHRISHTVNLFWTAHVVHHQSEHYNITVGLRASFLVPVFNLFAYSFFPFLGFSPDTVLFVLLIQGLYNLVIHTELVGKLGWLEYILVTPSSHRVHHARNEKYMDKNFGKMFAFWDLLFGTYIRETEQAEFGVLHGKDDNRIAASLFYPMKKISSSFSSEKEWKRKLLVLFGKPALAEEIYRERRKLIPAENQE